jgi:hypothetical protein
MKMPFMPDDNVSGNILGGEIGESDTVLYKTRDHRSEDERRLEERARNAKTGVQGKAEGKDEVKGEEFRTAHV